MFFSKKNNEEYRINAQYLFRLISFCYGIIIPHNNDTDLKSLKISYDDFLKNKAYGKSIECALQIAAEYTPIGFLLYLDTKLSVLKEQLKEGDIIDQEIFKLLTLVFFLEHLYENLSSAKEFKDLLVELINNCEWKKCLDSFKHELLTLSSIPLKKIEEAISVAEDFFQEYNTTTSLSVRS